MKTYWHQHPDTIERLAAEYALGTMPARARRRFERLMQQRPDVHQAVGTWHETLAPTLAAQKPMAMPVQSWQRLEARLFATGSQAQTAQRTPWWTRWFGPLPSGMLAAGLMMGLALPTLIGMVREGDPIVASTARTTQLPDSYVGVLATPAGQAGLVISSLRHGHTVDVKQQAVVNVPAGHTLYLWQIDKAGHVRPVAPLPDPSATRFVSVDLPQTSEVVFKEAIELAVSIEVAGQAPTQPSGTFVYRGLCGKVWMPLKK